MTQDLPPDLLAELKFISFDRDLYRLLSYLDDSMEKVGVVGILAGTAVRYSLAHLGEKKTARFFHNMMEVAWPNGYCGDGNDEDLEVSEDDLAEFEKHFGEDHDGEIH